MARNNGGKKDNPIVVGILFVIAGIILLFAKDYVWVLFGVLDIPLPILGVIGLVVGIIFLVIGIKEKRS